MIVKRTQNKSASALGDLIKEALSLQARIGFFESAKYPDGTPIAYVAAIQEHGAESQSIPPRPFFRPTIDGKKASWNNLAKDGIKKAANGSITYRQVMEGIGLAAQGDVSRILSQIATPPLSKITLMARKFKRAGGKVTGATIGQFARELKDNPNVDISGVSTKPLEDTGALSAHLTFEIGPKK